MPLSEDKAVADSGRPECPASLGTVLVASGSQSFCDAIQGLITECGYKPAFPAGLEAPWLSVTRTQPVVVVCDSDTPVRRLRSLVAEVSVRRVPLLITHAAEEHTNPRALAKVERVTWLRFPLPVERFREVLSALAPPVPGPSATSSARHLTRPAIGR